MDERRYTIREGAQRARICGKEPTAWQPRATLLLITGFGTGSAPFGSPLNPGNPPAKCKRHGVLVGPSQLSLEWTRVATALVTSRSLSGVDG